MLLDRFERLISWLLSYCFLRNVWNRRSLQLRLESPAVDHADNFARQNVIVANRESILALHWRVIIIRVVQINGSKCDVLNDLDLN